MSHLFKYYPKWSFYFLIFVHIFLIILFLSYYLWIPFVLNFGNSLTISIVFTVIFNDVFRIFAEFFQFKIEIFIAVSFSVFVIFTIFAYFIIRFYQRQINKNLGYSILQDRIANPNEPTEDEKFEYFTELKLDQNPKKAALYLIVGFTLGSDMFVDFSLLQFCFIHYQDSSQMIILLAHLLSYFKSQKNLFDQVLKKIHLLRENSFYSRYIYFQAHRIKLYRQFTPTNASSTLLNELKFLTNDLESEVKSFWSLKTASKNTIAQLEIKQRNLRNFWIESIEINYMSVSFHEGYIRFLIESCTDFQKAVQMEAIKERLSSFKDDSDDLCYLSLIVCLPHYLKNKSLNKNENRVLKKGNKTQSTSSVYESINERNSTTSTENDFTFEEEIANSLLTYGRLRLSMQNALKYCKPTNGKILLFYSIFLILVSSISIIVLFSIYVNYFNNFNNWDEEVGVLINLRLAYVRSFFCLSVFYGQKTERFGISPIECEFMNEPNRQFLELTAKFNELANGYANEMEVQFSNLIEVLLELSLTRVDTTALTSILFDPTIQANICYYGEIIDQINWSMEQVLNFEALSFLILSNESEENVTTWSNNSYWCHVTTNFNDVTSVFIKIQNSLVDDLYDSSNRTSRNIVLQMLIFGITTIIIFIIPLPIILYFYSKEIDHLIKIILSTDDEYKEQAQKHISLSHLNEIDNSIPPITAKSFYFKFFLFSLIVIISLACFIGFEILILHFAKSMSDKIRNIGLWSCNFSLLRAYLMELIIELINAVYYANLDQNYTSISVYKKQIYNIIHSFEILVYNIMNDTPKNPISVGFDPLIDQIVLAEKCENPDFYLSLHDVYRCGSLNNIVSMIHSLVQKIIEGIESYNGIFVGEELENIYHLIFAHAITDLINAGERYEKVQDEENDRFKIYVSVFFICGVLFIIVCSFFMSLVIIDFQRIFNMLICLIRRLSPVGFINNNELTNYLLYKKDEEVEMNVTHSIFNNSFDGIICLSVDGNVEIINKSFTSDYGYSTEQLVGQQIGIIFDNDSRIKVENQLKLMKNHESRDYSDHVICISNDGRKIKTHITLFEAKGNENSFILVVRDETILLEKKKRVEMAKKQSQDLLEQIVPPKVLMMMKQGKSEISFTVPSATVLFIDIVNFSRFSASLSPQQIMGTLSSLFGAFDIWIQKYPLMTKIKLIGDIYMAACGLFSTEEEEPKMHAKQGIDFSLRVMDILDDTNIKLNSSLQIRIGINSDGPIIAGVLGTENRVFDIIGDTINGASRLEHKAEPGHILMSEKTYELVNEFNFDIKPVGEVFLKGKGYMNAYTI